MHWVLRIYNADNKVIETVHFYDRTEKESLIESEYYLRAYGVLVDDYTLSEE